MKLYLTFQFYLGLGDQTEHHNQFALFYTFIPTVQGGSCYTSYQIICYVFLQLLKILWVVLERRIIYVSSQEQLR